jgi:glycosyltransferase involved in cell wall biosynthesis
MLGTRIAWQVFIFFSWMLAFGWLRQAISVLRGMPQLPDLTRIDAAALPPLPTGKGAHLTVVVPACNEEESIQATLRSLLASTGLRLEIIAVDDRSTDRTGVLMDQVAAEAVTCEGQHCLRVIHNNELPAGWLGKPHALHLGAQQATAPWLLFTDGDLLFAPQALQLALRQAIAGHTDHLTLAPSLIRKSIGEAAMQATVQALVQWSIRLWKVADPDAKDFFGVGGFNLIRTEVFTRLGGFAALRMEVVEDFSLGRMVKHDGYRSCVTVGPDLVRIRWIRGVCGIVANVEKNGFAVFRYRLGVSLAACLGIAVQVVLPLAAILAGGWALPAGLLIYASIALAFYANRRLNGVSPIAAVLFAPSAAIAGYGFLRSVVLTLARNGVMWRGIHYPLSDLRRNAVRWQ